MTIITEQTLQEMEAQADNEQWSRGDEGGNYPNYINWCEPMQENIHTLAAEVRRINEEYHITSIDKDLCIQDIEDLEAKIQSLEKRAVEAEHAAALWMRRAKELEASYEALRLRYAQDKR